MILPLVFALTINVSSSRLSDRRNTGPATSIESSRASVLVTLGGDLSVAANVSPNVTRAE